MTVKDLISILKMMPEDAEVQTEYGSPVENISVQHKEEKDVVRIA